MKKTIRELILSADKAKTEHKEKKENSTTKPKHNRSKRLGFVLTISTPLGFELGQAQGFHSIESTLDEINKITPPSDKTNRLDIAIRENVCMKYPLELLQLFSVLNERFEVINFHIDSTPDLHAPLPPPLVTQFLEKLQYETKTSLARSVPAAGGYRNFSYPKMNNKDKDGEFYYNDDVLTTIVTTLHRNASVASLNIPHLDRRSTTFITDVLKKLSARTHYLCLHFMTFKNRSPDELANIAKNIPEKTITLLMNYCELGELSQKQRLAFFGNLPSHLKTIDLPYNRLYLLSAKELSDLVIATSRSLKGVNLTGNYLNLLPTSMLCGFLKRVKDNCNAVYLTGVHLPLTFREDILRSKHPSVNFYLTPPIPLTQHSFIDYQLIASAFAEHNQRHPDMKKQFMLSSVTRNLLPLAFYAEAYFTIGTMIKTKPLCFDDYSEKETQALQLLQDFIFEYLISAMIIDANREIRLETAEPFELLHSPLACEKFIAKLESTRSKTTYTAASKLLLVLAEKIREENPATQEKATHDAISLIIKAREIINTERHKQKLKTGKKLRSIYDASDDLPSVQSRLRIYGELLGPDHDGKRIPSIVPLFKTIALRRQELPQAFIENEASKPISEAKSNLILRGHVCL